MKLRAALATMAAVVLLAGCLHEPAPGDTRSSDGGAGAKRASTGPGTTAPVTSGSQAGLGQADRESLQSTVHDRSADAMDRFEAAVRIKLADPR
jgi:hypothetical protein